MGTDTAGTSRAKAWAIGLGLAALVLLAAALLIRNTVQGFPSGTTLAGEPVSDPRDALLLAEQVASRLEGLPVRVEVGDRSTLATAGQLGASFSTGEVERAGRDAVGLDAWMARLTGGEPEELPTVLFFTTGAAQEVAEELTSPPVDGAIEITASGLRVSEAMVGADVTAGQVSEAFREMAAELETTPLAEWPDTLVVPIEAEVVQPDITQRSVDAAVERIESLTETPVALEASVVPEDGQTVDGQGVPPRETISLTLGSDELLQMLAVRPDPQNIERERLQVVASTETPPPSLVQFLDRAEAGPVVEVQVADRSPTPDRVADPAPGPGGPADQEAYRDISAVSGRLETSVVQPGLEPSVDQTIESIVQAMLDGEETAEVRGAPVEEADLAEMGIVEPVSTYTTFFEPGQGRVTNIHRIAEIVDGALVPPGGNYELNHAVGARTAAGGFVPAGAILEGEFITDVGGGVSQFGTTFFNAMWFAGLDIITHTPHSFWFDRYPAAREATIDYPGVNLELNNNTPHWILIDTAVTDNSVTVTFWSTRWFEVETVMGERQPTADGFRMTITRTASAPDGVVDDDRFEVSYRLP